MLRPQSEAGGAGDGHLSAAEAEHLRRARGDRWRRRRHDAELPADGDERKHHADVQQPPELDQQPGENCYAPGVAVPRPGGSGRELRSL